MIHLYSRAVPSIKSLNIHKPLIHKPFLCLLGCLLLVLQGCASIPDAAQPLPGGEVLSDGFIAEGKLSVRPLGDAAADAAVKGFTANFRWHQVGAQYDLELWGALGQGRTRITGTADKIKIVDGTGRTVKSRRPERLLQRHLGWSLPLAVLPYWLQGTAAPSPPAKRMRFQSNADMEVLEQLDWSLKFDRYSVVTGLTRQERLPGRVRASNDKLKLTIVTRNWSL